MEVRRRKQNCSKKDEQDHKPACSSIPHASANCWTRSTVNKILEFLFAATDGASLAWIRISFGFLMICDLATERRALHILETWGPAIPCHFPLFDCFKVPSILVMQFLYGTLFITAIGILVGYKFRASAGIFSLSYWYLFLLDTSLWNNHSYLYGLLSLLLLVSSAAATFSVDAWIDKAAGKAPDQVPQWNYLLIRFQICVVYFYAGVKKINTDWIAGLSVPDIGSHMIFMPVRYVLTAEEIELYLIHWGGLIFDLTVAFFMLWNKSRPIAYIFCTAFNTTNAWIFPIGMFPYVMLSLTPVFSSTNWPRKLLACVGFVKSDKTSQLNPTTATPATNSSEVPAKRLKLWCFALYMFLQLSLPFSHFITKGYNTWTDGLYGYSWDMMVQQWHTQHIRLTYKDSVTGQSGFLKPDIWTVNNRWTGHAVMAKQLAVCIRENLIRLNLAPLKNPEVYMDVWISMNRGFKQRPFKPDVDIASAAWSPFVQTDWVFPLLLDTATFSRLTHQISTSKKAADPNVTLTYIVDFPGYILRQFIPEAFDNVKLLVMKGSVTVVILESDVSPETPLFPPRTVIPLTEVNLVSGKFVDILVTSEEPSVYLISNTHI